ncbi:hypothetical protein ACIBW9_35200 [Streptomyces sp. NPDC049541]|uniref:hypothetical protein n=1 Tax=Streptomyces sp. NPDC049541 TaxID=3365594 RepID=UPI0037938CC0
MHSDLSDARWELNEPVLSAWRCRRHGRAEAVIHLVTTDLVARRFTGETTAS